MVFFAFATKILRIAVTSLLLSLALVSPAMSALIIPNITGADMVGIEVEAFYGTESDTATWVATSTDGSVPEGEGFAGEAAGDGWRLRQQGFTLGNVSIVNPGAILGLWTFENLSQAPITRFQVRGLSASVVFDIIGPGTQGGTPGSGTGRAFTPTPGSPTAVATYSDLFSGPDLFGTMDVAFQGGSLGAQQQIGFLADTDAISVPTPATSFLLCAGLCALLGAHTRLRYAS